MKIFILVVHILVVISLVVLVLVQPGKGSEMGAAFGSGASNTMFGSVGSVSFLVKLTSVLGVLFFVTSLLLGLKSTDVRSEPDVVVSKVIGD